VEIIQKVLIEKYPEVWTEIRDSVAERLQWVGNILLKNTLGSVK
jgi:hypothetical protein